MQNAKTWITCAARHRRFRAYTAFGVLESCEFEWSCEFELDVFAIYAQHALVPDSLNPKPFSFWRFTGFLVRARLLTDTVALHTV